MSEPRGTRIARRRSARVRARRRRGRRAAAGGGPAADRDRRVRADAFARRGGGNDDLRATATALRGRVEQALASAARALEPKAMAAARLPEIVVGAGSRRRRAHVRGPARERGLVGAVPRRVSAVGRGHRDGALAMLGVGRRGCRAARPSCARRARPASRRASPRSRDARSCSRRRACRAASATRRARS